MPYKRSLMVVLLALLTIVLFKEPIAPGSSQDVEIDVIGTVTKVVDGDTIDVKVIDVNSSRYSYLLGDIIRIRLADINAPELGTVEGKKAKNALMTILPKGIIVYLDIDDISVLDKYGRYVALVYKKYNESTLLNVNLWLVIKGYAYIVDFKNNEFNPHIWKLYISIKTETSSTEKPHSTNSPFSLIRYYYLGRLSFYNIDVQKLGANELVLIINQKNSIGIMYGIPSKKNITIQVNGLLRTYVNTYAQYISLYGYVYDKTSYYHRYPLLIILDSNGKISTAYVINVNGYIRGEVIATGKYNNVNIAIVGLYKTFISSNPNILLVLLFSNTGHIIRTYMLPKELLKYISDIDNTITPYEIKGYNIYLVSVKNKPAIISVNALTGQIIVKELDIDTTSSVAYAKIVSTGKNLYMLITSKKSGYYQNYILLLSKSLQVLNAYSIQSNSSLISHYIHGNNNIYLLTSKGVLYNISADKKVAYIYKLNTMNAKSLCTLSSGRIALITYTTRINLTAIGTRRLKEIQVKLTTKTLQSSVYNGKIELEEAGDNVLTLYEGFNKLERPYGYGVYIVVLKKQQGSIPSTKTVITTSTAQIHETQTKTTHYYTITVIHVKTTTIVKTTTSVHTVTTTKTVTLTEEKPTTITSFKTIVSYITTTSTIIAKDNITHVIVALIAFIVGLVLGYVLGKRKYA